jgi:ParB family transcriptional regulator, chromosome partitioning protein
MAIQNKKQALGRGLSALLKDPTTDISTASDKNADQIIGNIIEIDLKSIEVNPFQPRTHFNEEALQELANSILELGVIQPITVRKLEGAHFQLVSGERRLRAAKSIGLETIPAYVRLANDEEMLLMALVENIQRKDLDPIEVALSYQQLIDQVSLTQEELSQRVGKKRTTVTNYLRLLKLDPIIQTGMRDGFISMGHGRAIINIDDNEDQLAIYKRIIDRNLSVRQTEDLVHQFKSNSDTKPKTVLSQPEYIYDIEKSFANFFGSKVHIKSSKNGKGSIQIPFGSEEDLNRIKKLLK